eukprot:scaffold7352_cov254-Pinguiococcus_pyrenoidosus.AAC.29
MLGQIPDGSLRNASMGVKIRKVVLVVLQSGPAKDGIKQDRAAAVRKEQEGLPQLPIARDAHWERSLIVILRIHKVGIQSGAVGRLPHTQRILATGAKNEAPARRVPDRQDSPSVCESNVGPAPLQL